MNGPTYNGTKVIKFPIGITITPFSETFKSFYQQKNMVVNYSDLDNLLKTITTEAIANWNKELGMKVFELRQPTQPKNNESTVNGFALGDNNIIVYPEINAEEPLTLGGTTTWFKNERDELIQIDKQKLMLNKSLTTPSPYPFPVNSGMIRINFYALNKVFSAMVIENQKIWVQNQYNGMYEVDTDNILKMIGNNDVTLNQSNYLFAITHELGHALGLDHTDDTQSIMYKGLNHLVAKVFSEKKFEISKLDIAAIKENYQMKSQVH
ncbi:matrixin family metalloprotease [Marininema halotolerans]|uniref:Matrixin n=1 Tax=Marininema halotolerans TaxID=1155944 RepID=A0A1I6R923_9BACL|nr:matrixin family metalloprotease [Marininema halotolerans]SFS61156.1 Matrixin [Marininema halotolerans]